MSRRKAEEAILAGRVRLNGEVVRNVAERAIPFADEITLDHEPVKSPDRKVTLLFHKPKNIVTTKSDPQGRPTVMEYFREHPELHPVGRLDFDSEGLLLLTNDGDLTHRLTHPSFGAKKKYEVWTSQALPSATRKELLAGVALDDGIARFLRVNSLGERHYEIVVSEGRNRFIRRMFDHFGIQVIRLLRTEMGPYRLGNLKPGAWSSYEPAPPTQGSRR